MKDIEKPIFITRPNLPALDKVVPLLKNIWENKVLTNNGPYHQLFEKELSRFLEVEYVSLCTNATLALIVGLQSLELTGEVITTPFSFAATAHALHWNRLTPVFCDIEENTLNIDPNKIEALITPQTSAILPVHVFGHPCNVNKIQEIADFFRLKIIYDAAHAFNVKISGKAIVSHGDISVLSFHATKLFHTFEGGAIIAKNKNMKNSIDTLKNFGIADEDTVIAPGINAKMTEFQAAIGILGLDIIIEEIARRKKVADQYREKLAKIEGIKIFIDFPGVDPNCSYFPVLIDEELFGCSRDRILFELRKFNIFGRKYFFPLISNFPCYQALPSAHVDNLPVANRVSSQVLCLPIYGDLTSDIVDHICSVITRLAK